MDRIRDARTRYFAASPWHVRFRQVVTPAEEPLPDKLPVDDISFHAPTVLVVSRELLN